MRKKQKYDRCNIIKFKPCYLVQLIAKLLSNCPCTTINNSSCQHVYGTVTSIMKCKVSCYGVMNLKAVSINKDLCTKLS